MRDRVRAARGALDRRGGSPSSATRRAARKASPPSSAIRASRRRMPSHSRARAAARAARAAPRLRRARAASDPAHRGSSDTTPRCAPSPRGRRRRGRGARRVLAAAPSRGTADAASRAHGFRDAAEGGRGRPPLWRTLMPRATGRGELGMTRAVGAPYRHVLELLEEASAALRPPSRESGLTGGGATALR